jgi:phosphoribosylformylglycinamidine synthase
METALKTYSALHTAIKEKLVESAHDCSENGLAGALAEMAFSGEWGAKIDLRAVPAGKGIKYDWQILFSESNSRLIVEVKPVNRAAFEKILGTLPYAAIGSTNGTDTLTMEGLDGKVILKETLPDLKKAWKKEIV